MNDLFLLGMGIFIGFCFGYGGGILHGFKRGLNYKRVNVQHDKEEHY